MISTTKSSSTRCDCDCDWKKHHLIWLHWYDSAQSKYERMNVFHVQVISSHSIRHWVVGHHLDTQCRHPVIIWNSILLFTETPLVNHLGSLCSVWKLFAKTVAIICELQNIIIGSVRAAWTNEGGKGRGMDITQWKPISSPVILYCAKYGSHTDSILQLKI